MYLGIVANVSEQTEEHVSTVFSILDQVHLLMLVRLAVFHHKEPVMMVEDGNK